MLRKSGVKAWLPDMTDDAIRNLAAYSDGPGFAVAEAFGAAAFFLLLCNSTCGDPAGPMRCNVPLRNSEAFVETFSCQPGTPMHTTHMCPVFR
ncbi:hypothetical protein MRX96_008900 [Rhipicephalus microplus]